MKWRNNESKVKNVLKESRKELFDMIGKFCTAEEILSNAESAYAAAKCIELFDNLSDVAEEQARQIDDMENMLQDTYDAIGKLETKIDILNDMLRSKKD